MFKKLYLKLPNDFRNLSFLTSISLISNVIGLVRNLTLAVLLGVSEFGNYVLYLTFASYMAYLADMGFNAGALRLIPFYRGKFDNEKEQRVFSETYGITIAQGIFWLILFLFISFLFLNDEFFFNLLILLSFHSICTCFVNFLNLSARLNQRFMHVGISNLLISFVPLVSLLIVYVVNINIGFFVAGLLNIFGLFSCMLFLLYFETIKPIARIKFESLKKLIVVGFPLMISSVIGIFMVNIERIIVAEFLDDVEFGFYAFASTFGGVLIVVGTTWSYLRTQVMIETFSRNNSISEISIKGTKDLIVLTLLFTSIFPLVAVFSNLVPFFLEQYGLVTNALIFQAVAVASLSSWLIYNMINISLNKIKLNIFLGSFFIFLKLLIFYFSTFFNFDFEKYSLLNMAFNVFIIAFVCSFLILKYIKDQPLIKKYIKVSFFQLLVILGILVNIYLYKMPFLPFILLSTFISFIVLYYIYKNFSYFSTD